MLTYFATISEQIEIIDLKHYSNYIQPFEVLFLFLGM